MRDDRYLGEIYHHGIKGMKWGVRRSPEQLGHVPTEKLAKSTNFDKIESDCHHSEKGFVVQADKLTKFCLLRGGKHAEQFFKIGYSADEPERLFRDIEAGYDPSRKIDRIDLEDGHAKTSIPMKLGVTEQQVFRTVWKDDGRDGQDRFLTAYIDRRLKEEE